MKVYPSILFVCLLFSIAGCKKHPSGGNPNNEVKATVSFDSGEQLSINAHGDRTVFARSIFVPGDTVINISGYSDEVALETRVVSFDLCNITAPGTYKFSKPPASGTGTFINGSYVISDRQGLRSYYSTVDYDSTSTITITDLTATHIAGSVTSVTCGYAPDKVQIKNVSFKGDLTN